MQTGGRLWKESCERWREGGIKGSEKLGRRWVKGV